MENLLSNALKFSPEDSTVTVRLDIPRNGPAPNGHQPSLCIQIIDEGPGVPEDYRETIFDRYKVVKMKSADVTQVGIGLAFCKMVVEAHEGTIWVDDNLPQGAVFTLEL